MKPQDALRIAAQTYEQRNAVYGDNYKHFGQVMVGLFPGGLLLRSPDDWNRIGILVQIASKLTRYGANFSQGGHEDSAQDIIVYGSMLMELDAEIRNPKMEVPL